ncbi:GNAT family N-acetyltransferase [Thermomonospora umbrina]|uniref:Acetyltransferase (GNAT) family protein n=1 Tax=Thermomonospora umbrina TaxID=111806 RepID=A0A3D9T0G6_9ACTN|nr:GNAT family N-acetyltransferase [Thermomonospora umbrina]REE97321.1 acetyltransferase (GNAT) family protein [Thermomonospora umbrina]
MSEVAFYRLDGVAVGEVLDEVADLYVRVYAEPPYEGASKFSRVRFLTRTRAQAAAPGFALVSARSDGVLVGFSCGFSMSSGGWWGGASAPPGEVLDAFKFAVVEVVVDRRHRRQRVGTRLLEGLLDGRPERYATLAAVIGSQAYDWYLRSGWRKVGEFRAEPPFSDALVCELP